ncbi:hypothetical protein [Olsenella sp. HMSC062G07]|uniref:hypothetical protein n=1 Tax=Olsenella sp. HMSC062G07 TaxID=1739330 RepID=UPI0008A41BD9|nr:hypothetical protein [Olsenella sp. HMSC062G07]OFK23414.1 hypothetical protein HMPREF2826_04850 [Olsenella sp. HMSC062G07]
MSYELVFDDERGATLLFVFVLSSMHVVEKRSATRMKAVSNALGEVRTYFFGQTSRFQVLTR